MYDREINEQRIARVSPKDRKNRCKILKNVILVGLNAKRKHEKSPRQEARVIRRDYAVAVFI